MSKSKRWLQEHVSDHYVKRSKSEGYPSRAAYKLLEIQEKDKILRRGMLVVDLGAAPGGWSAVASEVIGPTGHVVAVDLLPMTPVSGVEFIQGDFNEEDIWQQVITKVQEYAAGGKVDLVISDMAPNISGQMSVDQPRVLHLVELAFTCAFELLKPGGSFVAKVFQGAGVDEMLKMLRAHFKSVKIRKPKSSRARSREFFVVAVGFKG